MPTALETTIPYKNPYGMPGISVLEYAGGANITDGVTYADDAFRKAIDAIKGADGGGGRGRILYVPFGYYRFAAPLLIDAAIIIQGDGSHGWENGATRLVWDEGQHGIIVQSQYTAGSALKKGDGTWLRDLFVGAQGKAVGFKHGITAHSKIKCLNVVVGASEGAFEKGFSGNGFNLVSGDLNVNDARRWWKADVDYTIGDMARAPGATRNLMTSTTGTLAVAAAGDIDGTIVVTRSIAWDNLPSDSGSDSFLIPSGSAIAGAGNTNVGWYLIIGVTSSTITARKRADSPYLVTSAFTAPVNVSAVAYAAGACSAYLENGNHYTVRVPGRSISLPTGTSTGITDGAASATRITWDYIDYLGIGNDWTLSECQAIGNGGNGLFTDGDNVNAGRTYSFTATANGMWGSFDYCFFGNAHFTPNFAYNAGGASRNFASNNQYGYAVIAGYFEADQPVEYVASPGSSVFGIKGSAQAYNTQSTGFRQTAGQMSVHYVDTTVAGKTVRSFVGGAGNLRAFSATHTDAQQGAYALKYDAAIIDGSWLFGLGGAGYEASFGILGGQYAAATWARKFWVGLLAGSSGLPSATRAGVQVAATNGHPLSAGNSNNWFERGTTILTAVAGGANPHLYVANTNCGMGNDWLPETDYLDKVVVPAAAPTKAFRFHKSSTGQYSSSNPATPPPWAAATTKGDVISEVDTGLKWEYFGDSAAASVDGIYALGALSDNTGSAAGTSATMNGSRKMRVKLASGSTVYTVTNNLITTSSIVVPVIQTTGGTVKSAIVVCTANTITVTCDAAATADINIALVLHD